MQLRQNSLTSSIRQVVSGNTVTHNSSYTLPSTNTVSVDPVNSTDPVPTQTQCVHDSCTRCGGSGVDKATKMTCVHALSCQCPKCTPYSM